MASSARCQGSSHVADGVPCQDQTTTLLHPDGVQVIALADGAGSAKLSHYGAYLVVSQSTLLVADKFDSFFSSEVRETPIEAMLVGQLQHNLTQLASLGINLDESDRLRLNLPSQNEQLLITCSLRDLASTFLLVAIKGNRYIALHLGDGVVGYEFYDPKGKRHLRPLSNPDNGEFVNETVFVTSSSARSKVKLYSGRIESARKSITGFILMSDGPEAALYHKSSKTLAPACAKLLEACRNLTQDEMNEQLQTALEDMISKKTSDDCSIALLAKK